MKKAKSNSVSLGHTRGAMAKRGSETPYSSLHPTNDCDCIKWSDFKTPLTILYRIIIFISLMLLLLPTIGTNNYWVIAPFLIVMGYLLLTWSNEE